MMNFRVSTAVVLCLFGTTLFATVAIGAEPGKKVFTADKGSGTVDVSQFPKDLQESYKVFSAKCGKCHTLARPINTNMEPKAWKMYVKRMMNKPDSGISPDLGKKIYKFLKWYQGEKDKKAKLAK